MALMGEKIKAKKVAKENKKEIFSPPWWVNPFLYTLFFLLPFFLITVLTAAPYMDKLGQKVNNLNFDNIMLGILSIAMLGLGALPFVFFKNKTKPSRFNMLSVNKALATMGLISLACNLVFFFPLFLEPQLIISLLSGSTSAMYEIRGTVGQIPGITSFISACLPFFSLYSYIRINEGTNELWSLNRKLLIILFTFIVMRSIFSSERLALVEGVVAYGIPYFAFSWRPSLFRMMIPFGGVVGVFSLFCVGEYFRSWQFYKLQYESFWEFITVRFFGYFATSFNNGSGIMTYYDTIGMPVLTASYFYKLLAIFGVDYRPGLVLIKDYIYRYASPEFNLASGLYMPYIDYGIIGGAIYLCFFGLLTSLLYRSFLSGKPLGILLYPMWYLALLDIMRTWIWGSSRFVPVLLVSLAVSIFLVYKKEGIKENSLTRAKAKSQSRSTPIETK